MTQGNDGFVKEAGLEEFQQKITDAKNAIAGAAAGQGRADAGVDAMVDVLDQLGAQIGKVKLDTHDVQRYALVTTVGNTIVGTAMGLARASLAFQAGRAAEGAAEVVKAVGASVKLVVLGLKMAGAISSVWGGPIGLLISELMVSLGAGLIEGLGTAQKSLREQLRAELAEFGGREHADRLEGVLDALERVQADLHARPSRSLTWDEVNRIGRFTGPDEVIALGMAEHWLRRETDAEVWTVVFKTYCTVATLSLQNFVVGLAKMRDKEGEAPLPDTAIALEVLGAICTQHQEMLKQFRPKAVSLGTRWFIGTNDNLYCVKQNADSRIGFHDTFAAELAVTEGHERLKGDAEQESARRVWHLGGNGVIYTMMRGEWYALESTEGPYAHFDAVQEPGSGKVFLSALREVEGKEPIVTSRVWNEAIETMPKLEPGSEVLSWMGAGSVSYAGDTRNTWKVARLVGRGDGAVYAIGVSGRVALLQRGKPCEDVTLPAATVEGLAVGRDDLYVFDAVQIWTKPLAQATDPWRSVRDPRKDLALAEGAPITDLCALADGALTAVIDGKIYVFDGQRWSPTDGNTAKRAVGYPVDGWEPFIGLVSAVESIESVRDALKPVPKPAS